MNELQKRSSPERTSHISNIMIHTHTRRYRIFPEQNKEHRFKSTNTLGTQVQKYKHIGPRMRCPQKTHAADYSIAKMGTTRISYPSADTLI
jgi:hypothetical protein